MKRAVDVKQSDWRWGIDEHDGRFEVWGRMLQFRATCETVLDAKTVLIAALAAYEQLELRSTDPVAIGSKSTPNTD